MFRDYRSKGVEFYYVYKTVQHPEINNFLTAFTIEERLRHIAEAKRRFRTEIPWICDTMDNTVKQAFGGAPNGEFILDSEGTIVRKRFWSNPDTLRRDLGELVGPVDPVTTVDDLPARFTVETRPIASGVVPRIALPGGLRPLQTTPIIEKDGHPFFAKLRVEATQSALGTGKGKLYLGVYLDPLYQVHWNNRAGRVAIEVTPPDGIELSEHQLQSPVVKADADVDPRQFLIDISGRSDKPLRIAVTYTACDDAQTFCLTIRQQYEVMLKPSRGAGSRPGIFMPAMFANVRTFDKNKDGRITPDELPEGRVTLYVGHMDYNANGVIESDEVDTFLAMFNNGRGFDSANNDGQKQQ